MVWCPLTLLLSPLNEWVMSSLFIQIEYLRGKYFLEFYQIKSKYVNFGQKWFVLIGADCWAPDRILNVLNFDVHSYRMEIIFLPQISHEPL